jgi:hypothetical protein
MSSEELSIKRVSSSLEEPQLYYLPNNTTILSGETIT